MKRVAVRSYRNAFTLIELLVVMVILGTLAALIMPKILERPEQARRVKAKLEVQNLKSAVQQFKLDTGRFPATSEALEALVTDPGVPGWLKGGYIERVPQDPWGHPYVYRCPGSNNRDMEIVSYGTDGQPGGNDNDADVESWNLEGK